VLATAAYPAQGGRPWEGRARVPVKPGTAVPLSQETGEVCSLQDFGKRVGGPTFSSRA